MYDPHHYSYLPEVHSVSFDTVVWVLNHSEAAGADRLVLIALASHQNGRVARPAVTRLCEETLLQRRSVFRSLARLEESKAIEVIHRGPGRGGTNAYFVRTEKVTECHQLCCKGDRGSSTRVTVGPEKVTLSPSKGDPGSPELLKSFYELPKARVTTGHLSSNKGDLKSPSGEGRPEPVNPYGAGAPCLGDPCPACGDTWTLGHRCDT